MKSVCSPKSSSKASTLTNNWLWFIRVSIRHLNLYNFTSIISYMLALNMIIVIGFWGKYYETCLENMTKSINYDQGYVTRSQG